MPASTARGPGRGEPASPKMLMDHTVRRVRRIIRRRLLGRPSKQLRPADLSGQPVASGVAPEALLQWVDAPEPLRGPDLAPAGSTATPDDVVLGIEWGGDDRAYPLTTVGWRHVVNDAIGGRAVLITICPRCRSGAAFDPHVDGRALTFRLFGGYNGTVVMQDEQTGTLWSHVTGQALAGPLVGHAMEQLPVEMMALGRWLERHPGSLAPAPDPRGRRSLPSPALQDWQRRTIHAADERLAPDARVLGVWTGADARAYVLDVRIPPPRMAQGMLGVVPVVLLGSPGSWPHAFDRRHDGEILEFAVAGDLVRDAGGSAWTGSGVATDGPRAGQRLRFIPSIVTNWHAWSGYHPATEIARLAPASPEETPPAGAVRR